MPSDEGAHFQHSGLNNVQYGINQEGPPPRRLGWGALELYSVGLRCSPQSQTWAMLLDMLPEVKGTCPPPPMKGTNQTRPPGDLPTSL